MGVATKIKDFFKMRKLTTLLKDKNVNVKSDAVWELWCAVKKGQDINTAVPTLANALQDENVYVRYVAAGVLVYHYLNKRDENKITELLTYEDAYVRWGAALELNDAARAGQDITAQVRALANALQDKNADVRWNAAWALAYHYLNKRDENKITELLGYDDAHVRESVSLVLNDAAKKGHYITAAVPALANALGYGDAEIRKNAAEALMYAALNGQEITLAVPALTNALGDENADVRWNAAWALENFVSKCNSIEKLNETQAVIERSFKEWFDKNRNNIDQQALVADVKNIVSKLSENIKKRKVALSTMGGIMLDGVVKPPENKGRLIYNRSKIRC